MGITVEEAFANLIRILSERRSHPQTYVLNGNLISAQMSLVSTSGASAEFPRMLYKPMREGEDLIRIVQDVAEQQAAEEDGFRTTPSPAPPGYPQQWVELDVSRGSDWLRIRIRNAAEEKTFKAMVVDEGGKPTKWVRDDEYRLAGRGIGLDDLVAERKEKLKRMVDEDALEFVEPPPSENAGVESAGEEREPK